ncbi:IQ domain-containing protein E isoform X2 [Strigops habroptila]|uniref:IQ domain-containing protein E isoform X2 n=1 Tax=Strigops habroptila TaxID=2489341 RepID=UPI0011CFDC9E|nr:IQ domain-containing protein E isoform X2 [Strigops habroptila]
MAAAGGGAEICICPKTHAAAVSPMETAASEDVLPARAAYTQGDDGPSAITCELDPEMKLKKKLFSKPPKLPSRSPYSTQLYSRKAAVWPSLQGTGSEYLESAAVKNSRLRSLKQGMSYPVKSDVDMGHMQAGFSSTPEYLKEVLGTKKPKHSRSSSNGKLCNGYVPGNPNYKEKEDMYDEIIELKKTIQAQKIERHQMKTKLRRLEEMINRKDKQIENLLDPFKGSEMAQTLSEKMNNNGWVVNGLKQKILKLQQLCKERDKTINKFQAEMKSTNLEEMKIAMETCSEEVHHLQQLLEKSEAMRKNTESRETQKHLKALNAAVLRLSRTIKNLQAENRRLKEDLDHVLCSSPPSNETESYSEWSKPRLVRRILELEKKICALENARVPSADTCESELFAPPCSAEDLDHPASQQVDYVEECHRLQGLVKKLQRDKRALRSFLLSKEVEIQNLTQKLGKLETKEEEEKSQMSEDKVEKLLKFSLQGKDHQRRQQAARIIQRYWKKYRDKRDVTDLDEAIITLQTAFRGHLGRQKLLLKKRTHDANSHNKDSCRSSMSNSSSSSSDCKEKDEMLPFIQSVFRAHLARKEQLVESALCEKGDSAVHSPEKKPVLAAVQRRPSNFMLSLPAL